MGKTAGLDRRIERMGELGAPGGAALPAEPVPPPPVFSEAPLPPAPPAERPPADETTLAVRTRLAINPFRVTDEYAEEYLRTVREIEPLYSRQNLIHPDTTLHISNWLLRHNVVLG